MTQVSQESHPVKKIKSRSNDCKTDFYRKTSLMKLCETFNEFTVISYLFDHGPATRGDIVRDTPVKWTTAHDSLIRLQVKGIIKREVVPRGRGRPFVYWSLKD
ncbi:MAG: hypothetical protein ACFFD4_08470 [Candidatus Odinarchaeota archaeon]